MEEATRIRARYTSLRPFLDERRRRLWAANEALVLGRGGVTVVAAATGLARNTIRDGLRELRAGPTGAERAQPVVSIDAKKKELVGDFKNGGREGQPKGQPEPVRVHDFPDQVLGKVTPYGVFDVTANQGWVSVGADHDTAAFAVDTVQRW